MQQPHAVIVMPNNVEIDARAHRNGLALAAAGFKVTMVGYGTGLPPSGEISGIPYFLTYGKPLEKRLSFLYRAVRKAFHLTLRRRPPQQVLKVVARVDGASARLKKLITAPVAAVRTRRDRVAAADPQTWQAMLPFIADMEDAMFAKVVELRPDLIIGDVHLLHLAKRVADRFRGQGRKVSILYDAREYVYGLASEDPNVLRGFPALEAEFIRDCDAVVTVCGPIARFLAEKYGIPEPPLVPNAPIGNLPETGKPMTIRDFLDVDPEAPILAYAGGLSVHRGVHDAVEALAALPGVHLAVGARRPSSYTLELDQQARRLGVRDRLHFVPFAPTHEVAEYLASATAAIFPFLPVGNHNWAAPNKYFESVQARLPILTSNMEWLGERVTRLGVGEVFEHSNPTSLAQAAKKLLADVDTYRARITDDLVAEHTFEHFSSTLVDTCLRTLPEELHEGLRPHDLTAQLHSIRRDMVAQRASLSDSELFEARPRLRIGTTNSAGQATEWAHALMREYPRVIADSAWLKLESRQNYAADEVFTPTQAVTRYWLEQMKSKLASRYTHVLSESGRPLAGNAFGKYFWQESEWLTHQGIRQGLVFHGSDIRSPREHSRLEPWSPFRGELDEEMAELTEKLQRRVDHLLPHVKAFDGPVFVTTADLLDYLPDARWLPLTIDTGLWHSNRTPMAHGKTPVVLHVPSKERIKGSEYVDAACEELQARGLIRYVRECDVTHAEMRELVLGADIVIDQVRIGDYGLAAVEAMSAGRAVVGHLSDRVVARYPEEPPIVRATPDTLLEALEGLVGDPERVSELGSRGRSYAREFHDGRRAARVLAEFMQVSG